MGFAALIMSLSIVISRFMGLARDKVISWQFGTSPEADLYFVAFVIPDFINYLLAGGYVSITLMPLLSKYFSPSHSSEERKNQEADGWRFFSSVFWWALIAISLLTLTAWIYADNLAPYVAPGFDAEHKARLVTFLRIILPAQIFFVSGACFSALLFLRKQFFVPALTPLIYNGCIILCGVLFPIIGISTGMEGFCIGVTIGAAIGAWILPAWAVARHGLTLHLSFTHPRMKTFLIMALPLMLGQSVVMLNEQFLRIFGSMAGEGTVSLLSYARRLSQVPVGMVGQALAVASYPFLATLAAEQRMDTFYETLRTAIRTSIAILLPVSAWLIAAALPATGIIFEGGDFGIQQTHLATPLLQILLLAVPLWGVQMVLGRAFYALGDTLTPALCGTAVTFLTVPAFYASAALPMPLGISNAMAIALVSISGVLLYIAIIVAIWNKNHGSKAFSETLPMTVQGIIISTLAAIAAYFVAQQSLHYTTQWHNFFAYTLSLGTSFIIFLGVYILLTRTWAPALYTPIKNMILRKKQS